MQASKWLRLVLFFLGFALTFVMVFAIYDQYHAFNAFFEGKEIEWWSMGARITWNILSRPLFIIGLIFVLLPTFTGQLRGISSFLGTQFWTPIARLTFSAYLVHPLILTW